MSLYFITFLYGKLFLFFTGREIEILVSSGIVNEDALTFAHTFDLVLEVAPQLAIDPFVLLLDGDRATWQAAKHKFRNVVIVLCLFHASENMKRRFGPICRNCPRKNNTQSSTADETTNVVRWIQCQSPECNKWRKLKEKTEYPSTFVCSEVDYTAKLYDCDTPQDDDFQDGSLETSSSSEVRYCYSLLCSHSMVLP